MHSTKWSDGKKKKGWKPVSSKEKNSIQDSVGNEENGYIIHDLYKTMINVTKEPSDTYIKTLKEEIWKLLLMNLWRSY
jgi:hypothetical protein